MKLLLIAILTSLLVACSIVPTDKRTIELPTEKYRPSPAKEAIAKFKEACDSYGWLYIDGQKYTCKPEDK